MKIGHILRIATTFVLGLEPVTGHSQTYYYSGPIGGYVSADLAPDPGSGGFAAGFGTLTDIWYYNPIAQTLQEVGSVTISPSTGSFDMYDGFFPGHQQQVVGSATLIVGTNGSFAFTNTYSYGGSGGGFRAKIIPVPVTGSAIYNGQPLAGSWTIEIAIGVQILGLTPTSLTFSEYDQAGETYSVGEIPPGLNAYNDPEGDSPYASVNWNLNSAVATLETGPASIISQPQSLLIDAPQPVSFSVTAYGTSPIIYQWSLDGTNIPGATSSILTISNMAQMNLGTYTVVVTNQFGTATSSNATLSMYPYIVAPFTGAVTYWGQSATLSVGAWGTGALSYQWYQNGVALPNATNQTLTMTAIQATNAGLYSVVVTSPLGSVTNPPAQVVVEPAGVSVALYPGVTIDGVVGYNYIIQSTTNLGDTKSWVTVTTLTLTQSNQLWMDTNSNASVPGNSYRFYQVLPGQ